MDHEEVSDQYFSEAIHRSRRDRRIPNGYLINWITDKNQGQSQNEYMFSARNILSNINGRAILAPERPPVGSPGHDHN